MESKFYVNGTDFPPEENIPEGSIFQKSTGELLRRTKDEWIPLEEADNE